MKHETDEVYCLNPNARQNFVYCTADYLQAKGITIHSRTNPEGTAGHACYIKGYKGRFKYLDAQGETCYGYVQGQGRIWFDSEQERDQYYIDQKIEQEAKQARNKVKRAILEKLDAMSVEELTALLKKI